MTIESPIGDMVAVTPNDSAAILTSNGEEQSTRALYVGVGGDVSVITDKGQTVMLKNMAEGVWHPMRITHVRSTGTVASDLLGGY